MQREMNKIILITRKTRLAELIRKYNTPAQAKFYLEHLGADFSDYTQEDIIYSQAVRLVARTAEKYGRLQQIDRDFLPNMIFGARDTVIAVGQDGLVANTLKYLNGQPLIGVNPDPCRWDGCLLPFEAQDMETVLPKVLAQKRPLREITMARAVTQSGQAMLAVNDLFIGQKTHVSARYRLAWNQRQENQSSSGILISTGLGSTGWRRSVLTQAAGIAQSFGRSPFAESPQAWDDPALTFLVREPFPSRTTQTNLIYGRLQKNDTLKILSQMPENSVVFSDGIESDAIEFNAGTEITIQTAPTRGILAV